MKLLIGTLKTIENEFEECCKSINYQLYKKFDHIVIENLGDAEAHDKLYSTFQNNSDKFDLLIKIDADMVIADTKLFSKIVKEFEENERLDRLFIHCYDHFVGENLGGVNVYRNTVKWQRNEDNFFTDRGHLEDTIRETKSWNVPEDKPLIHHCPNPSNYQAFHFGLHRMMKTLQPGVSINNANISKVHWRTFSKIIDRYKVLGTNNLKYALLGGESVLSCKFQDDAISYGNQEVEEIFKKYDNKLNEDIPIKVICRKLFSIMSMPYPYNYWYTFLKFRFK